MGLRTDKPYAEWTKTELLVVDFAVELVESIEQLRLPQATKEGFLRSMGHFYDLMHDNDDLSPYDCLSIFLGFAQEVADIAGQAICNHVIANDVVTMKPIYRRAYFLVHNHYNNKILVPMTNLQGAGTHG